MSYVAGILNQHHLYQWFSDVHLWDSSPSIQSITIYIYTYYTYIYIYIMYILYMNIYIYYICIPTFPISSVLDKSPTAIFLGFGDPLLLGVQFNL